MTALEAFTNATLGLLVSFVAVQALWPLFGWTATVGQSASVTGLFWALSFIRSYIVRRAFKCLS